MEGPGTGGSGDRAKSLLEPVLEEGYLPADVNSFLPG